MQRLPMCACAQRAPAPHQQLHRLLAADGDRARDLLITADAERAHSVARLAEHRLLASQLLQHLWNNRAMDVGTATAAPCSGPAYRTCLPHCLAARSTPTLAAFCRRSPDSPTQMLSTSFDTRISRMGLPDLPSFYGSDDAAQTEQQQLSIIQAQLQARANTSMGEGVPACPDPPASPPAAATHHHLAALSSRRRRRLLRLEKRQMAALAADRPRGRQSGLTRLNLEWQKNC